MTRAHRHRILLLTNLCPPDHDGGYGLRAFEIANALRERGHYVDVITSKYREQFRGEHIEQKSVHRLLQYIPTSASKSAWRYLDRIPRRIACTTVAAANAPVVRDFLAGRRYDLAYCFSLERVGLATLKPVAEAGIPILWHAGDGYIADQLFGFAKRYPGYRTALSLIAGRWFKEEHNIPFDHVAFVSEFLRRDCADKGFCPPNTYLIPRGYAAPIAYDIDRPRVSPAIFLMASRVEREKGVHVAVRAATILRQRRPELAWRLAIAGTTMSGYEERITQNIRRAGLCDRVELLGGLAHDDVLAKIRSASAFLSCSTYGEPFASTIIEALANGTPLIASNVGSILEVVVPGDSALLYENEDANALAEHMEAVLDSADLRRRLALAGVRLVNARYTLSKILDQTEAVFAKILESNRQPASSKVAGLQWR